MMENATLITVFVVLTGLSDPSMGTLHVLGVFPSREDAQCAVNAHYDPMLLDYNDPDDNIWMLDDHSIVERFLSLKPG